MLLLLLLLLQPLASLARELFAPGSLSPEDVCLPPVEPPPARSPGMAAHRDAVDRALHTFWGTKRSGYVARASADDDKEDAAAKRASTYGEITALGMRQLARAMGLDDPPSTLRQPLVFVDLGSGVGKVVVQAFLEWPAVGSAVGIELSPERAAIAREAWRACLSSDAASRLRAAAEALEAMWWRNWTKQGSVVAGAARPEQGVQLLEGDLFDLDVSQATHMYVASLCFDTAMLQRVAAKLSSEARSLEVIASLRRLPDGLPGFVERSLQVQTSWTAPSGATSLTYVYSRKK